MTNDNGTYSRLAEIAEEETGRPKVLPAERPAVRSKVQPAESTKVLPARVIEHRSYDFFVDQVRWLNRRKLELEETFGRKVPATVMVQLAIDLFIKDFEENGENSNLIRLLITEERSDAVHRSKQEDDG